MSEKGEDDLSLSELVRTIWASRLFIVATVATVLVLTLVYSMFARREFTVSSSFAPQSRTTSSSAAGLAAQLGLSIPASEGAQSGQFYVDLVRSYEILSRAVRSTYEITTDNGPWTGTLVAYYKIDEPDTLIATDVAVRRLAKGLSAFVSQKTGVVTLAVTVRDRSLALQINRRILELLDKFNQEARRTQALAERQFAESRVSELERDVRSAEDRLSSFLARNRELQNSPELAFQRERLAREVQLRAQVYGTLVEALERARLDEVRDTPLISIVEPPRLPARPDSVGLFRHLVVALVGSLFAAVFLVLLRRGVRT
jgi:uncharacterized protein involved in exopolysaccharide biosynthesis